MTSQLDASLMYGSQLEKTLKINIFSHNVQLLIIPFTCACVLLYYTFANKRLSSAVELFRNNYDENEHIGPIQATNPMFCV